MYNASERKDIRKAEKAAKLAETQRHEIVKGIMSVAPGRQWMLERLEACHVFASSFTVNPYAVAFAEGERNIGLQILNDIMQACPDYYTVMMKERNERDAARSTASERSRSQNGDGGDPGSGDTDEPDSAYFTAGDAADDSDDTTEPSPNGRRA